MSAFPECLQLILLELVWRLIYINFESHNYEEYNKVSIYMCIYMYVYIYIEEILKLYATNSLDF